MSCGSSSFEIGCRFFIPLANLISVDWLSKEYYFWRLTIPLIDKGRIVPRFYSQQIVCADVFLQDAYLILNKSKDTRKLPTLAS